MSSCRARLPPRGAEREPHAHLDVSAVRAADEKQVGDVHAGHEQNEKDDAAHRQQRPGGTGAAGPIDSRFRPPRARGMYGSFKKAGRLRGADGPDRPRISGCIARSAAVADSIDWPGLSRNMAVNSSAAG